MWWSIVLLFLLQVLYATGEASAAGQRNVTIFQAVDDTFFPLWANWWAIALKLKVIPKGWKLHIACMGEKAAVMVQHFHSPGCTRVISGREHEKKIFRVKWSAITEAFRAGDDLFVFDIDAMLIRNPLDLLGRNYINEGYDIISSTDHGPEFLPFSETWAQARFCVGLMFLRYSEAMMELVDLTMNRIIQYGDDQIQFNKLLSNSAIVWETDPQTMRESVTQDFFGHMYWYHPRSVDYLHPVNDASHPKYINRSKMWTAVQFASEIEHIYQESVRKPEMAQRIAMSARPVQPPVKLKIRIFSRNSVLRGCLNNTIGRRRPKTWVLKDMTVAEKQSAHVLHCFDDNGPVGQQGVQKGWFKVRLFQGLHYWVLRPNADGYQNFLNVIGNLAAQSNFTTSGSLRNTTGVSRGVVSMGVAAGAAATTADNNEGNLYHSNFMSSSGNSSSSELTKDGHYDPAHHHKLLYLYGDHTKMTLFKQTWLLLDT